jgi:hypothetical protein
LREQLFDCLKPLLTKFSEQYYCGDVGEVQTRPEDAPVATTVFANNAMFFRPCSLNFEFDEN